MTPDTSEWHTQVARSVRSGVPGRRNTLKLASYVFTTFCGSRPAEACSLTVAATQQLLTQILFHLMYSVLHYETARPGLAGAAVRSADSSPSRCRFMPFHTVTCRSTPRPPQLARLLTTHTPLATRRTALSILPLRALATPLDPPPPPPLQLRVVSAPPPLAPRMRCDET